MSSYCSSVIHPISSQTALAERKREAHVLGQVGGDTQDDGGRSEPSGAEGVTDAPSDTMWSVRAWGGVRSSVHGWRGYTQV